MFQSTLSTNMVLQGKFRCKIEGCSAVFDNSALKLQHISENHRKSLQVYILIYSIKKKL